MRKTSKNYRKKIGKPWENKGKTKGKLREKQKKHRKTKGKTSKKHRKTIGKPRENQGQPRNDGCLNVNLWDLPSGKQPHNEVERSTNFYWTTHYQ